MKQLIGILDIGLSGLNVFETLVKTYPRENFLFQNNLRYYPYTARPEAEIQELIHKDINNILKEEPSMLIILSNMILEYGKDIIEKIEIPIIRIDELIINYINENYEQKRMLFLAREDVIKANIYQRQFIYNQLYNIASDELESIIEKKQVKTATSFKAVRTCLREVLNKEIDVIITGSPYLINLWTEFREYINFRMITDIGMIAANEVGKRIKESTSRKRGSAILKSSIPQKEFKKMAYWLDLKYKVKEY